MIRRFALLLCLLLPGCDSGDRPLPTSLAEATENPEATPGIKVETCSRCGYRGGNNHQCGHTRWCPTCRRDSARDHECGKTDYCRSCMRETGFGHVCGQTRICWRPACRQQGGFTEGGANHICQQTRFCTRCKLDTVHESGHDCGLRTYACPRCEREATKDHVCGKSRYCHRCGHAASLSVGCAQHDEEPVADCKECRHPHDCGQSFFCPTCEAEKPSTHHH